MVSRGGIVYGGDTNWALFLTLAKCFIDSPFDPPPLHV